MGEVSPPTTADYAQDAARDANRAIAALQARVDRLEKWAVDMQTWAQQHERRAGH